MNNLILIAILVAVIGAAAVYVYRAKKRGVKCIGCPNAGKCGGCSAGAACGCHEE